MCRVCWSQVSPGLQREVYRTVGLRGPSIDKTWAAWWRASHRAIAEVAAKHDVANIDAWLAKSLAFADSLEA